MPPYKRSRTDTDAGDAASPRKTGTSFKKQKNTTTAAAASKDDTPSWELGNKRRVTVSQFNKATLVNIREYYEKDGEMLPGKKGISLSVPQWQALLSSIGAINSALRTQGVTINPSEDNNQDEDIQMGSDSNSGDTSAKKGKKKGVLAGISTTATSGKKKSNIEATSDEAEDESDDSSDEA